MTPFLNGFRRILCFAIFCLLFASTEAGTSPTARIQIVISVDWEGGSLESDNLAAMSGFRDRFPQVPLLQFLNAAYYTKPDAQARQVTEAIRSVLRPIDELGLHLHGWKRLFEASGVKFRDQPSFWGSPELSGDCSYDCGHEVPISAYSTEELRKVIRNGARILSQNGFGAARSFRAGGWMASPSVLEALVSEGFLLDSSAVPPPHLRDGLEGFPLFDWVQELWADTTTLSQPFQLRTSKGDILELPDSGGLADYVTTSQMKSIFQETVSASEEAGGTELYLHFGFHEETAERYLPQLEKGLRAILTQAQSQGVLVTFPKLPFNLPMRRTPTHN